MQNKEKKPNTLRFLSLPVDQGGCGWYRVRQPFNEILQHTEHDAYVVDTEKDDMQEVYKAMMIADVIVIRQGGEAGRRQLLEKYPEIKAKWVLDIDDNIEIISPYSEHYKDYGVREYHDKYLKRDIWKDGENGFNSVDNQAKVDSLLKGMEEVDLITVTTPYLAEYAKKYNKNVKITPNCINHDHWWKLNLKSNKKLRVGWSGGVSHYEDWYAIRKPLNALLKEFDFTLVMVGSHYGGLIDKENRDKVELHPWLPFKGHSYRMMALALDIAIIPLADLPFNHYKSPIKWYEMSSMGVPSVVSGITPYKEVIKEGKTALTYKTTKQFSKALRTLLTKPALRKKLGFNARKWVKDNRDSKKCASIFIDAYQSIL